MRVLAPTFTSHVTLGDSPNFSMAGFLPPQSDVITEHLVPKVFLRIK